VKAENCSASGRRFLPSFYSFTIGAAPSNRGELVQFLL
jgi:hypothetical protein